MGQTETANSVARLLLTGLGGALQAKADQNRQLVQIALRKQQADIANLTQIFLQTGDPKVGEQLQELQGTAGQPPLKTPASVIVDEQRIELLKNQTLASGFNLAAAASSFVENIEGDDVLKGRVSGEIQKGNFGIVTELVSAGRLPKEFERKFRDAEGFFADHPEMLADMTPEGKTEAILSFATGRSFLDARQSRAIIDNARIQVQVGQQQLDDLLTNNRGELTFLQRFEHGQANMRNYLTAKTLVEGVQAAKQKVAADQTELDQLTADPDSARKNAQRILELKSNIRTESANVTLTDQGIADFTFYISEMERTIYNQINGAGRRLGATGGTLALEDIDANILNTTAGLNQRTQVVGVSAALGIEVPPEAALPAAAPGFTTPGAPSAAVPGAPPTTLELAAPAAPTVAAPAEKKKLSRLTTLATKMAAEAQAFGFSAEEKQEITALATELEVSISDVIFILKGEIERIRNERQAERRKLISETPEPPGGQFAGAAAEGKPISARALEIQKQLQGE